MNPLVTAALKRIERAHQPAAQELRYSYPASLSAAVGSTDKRTARAEVTREIPAARPAIAPPTFDQREIDTHPANVQSNAVEHPEASSSPEPTSEITPIIEAQPEPEPALERTVNLIVVPPAPVVAQTNVLAAEAVTEKPKPKRVISDDSAIRD